MKNRVLVVASHPDDEVLGVGGTIARHVAAGDEVHLLILGQGAAARRGIDADAETERLKSAASKAAEVLGAQPPILIGMADNRLDTVPLLDIAVCIEEIIASVQPQTVYTHHIGDLNRDHRVTREAVEVACRPLPDQTVTNLYAFETVSSTEWSVLGTGREFAPNRFVDIGAYFETKMQALRCYDFEMRSFPHARSYEAIEALARLRGAQVGMTCAEAFTVLRELAR